MTKCVKITVRGIVQGVGFRMYTMREAERLGLGGYVRNLPDGSVEMVAEGEAEIVNRLIAWAKHGPRAAVVGDVSVEECEPRGELTRFDIRD